MDVHDSQYWTDFATASAAATARGADWGVGFVFTENDPYWFLDVDNCLMDGQPPVWSPLAVTLATLLAGCAVEISHSGKGLHFFGRGTIPPHGCTNKALGLEFYHTARFVALTGTGAIGGWEHDATAALAIIVDNYFGPNPVAADTEWSTEADPGWNGPAEDGELIRRAMLSQSANSRFGTGATFADLWLCNVDALSQAYPDPARDYDASAADAALAQHLAFWTGKNCERIQKLMFESKLARDKWTDRADYYLPLTIGKAVARQIDVLCDKPVAAVPSITIPPTPAAPLSVDGFMGVDGQIQHFKGCIYVMGQHKAFVPGGMLLKPEQFKVMFGGFIFNLDRRNDKVTKDAWEAWTLNQGYRCVTVDGTCFKPNLPPGGVSYVSGQSFVNMFVPVDVRRVAGDPAPFLKHLAKVLPNKKDAEVLLSYMAACVQYQGVKFQWAPLLQGVEGNGKTLFTRCVAEAIGRRYIHFPPANEISEKFNSWLFDRIFIGVEDIYVPNQKQEVFEILKPMITSDFLAKRAMQTDQVMHDVVANFIFNSNHKDGLRKTQNDRRICMLFCAQQGIDDLTRDRMHGDYFQKMYEWLKADGYAIVAEYLYTYKIPAALNPAGDCQRAPVTSSTAAAIGASSGNVEQEIEEAVEQGLSGFAGGWVSSIWLDRLLERLGLARKVSHHRRNEILEAMGYRPHPALVRGRVNNTVLPDGGKPRLFIHKDSLAGQITDAAAVAKAYELANAVRLASFSKIS